MAHNLGWVLAPLLLQRASLLGLPLPSSDLRVAFRIKFYVEKPLWLGVGTPGVSEKSHPRLTGPYASSHPKCPHSHLQQLRAVGSVDSRLQQESLLQRPIPSFNSRALRGGHSALQVGDSQGTKGAVPVPGGRATILARLGLQTPSLGC